MSLHHEEDFCDDDDDDIDDDYDDFNDNHDQVARAQEPASISI